MLDQLTPLTGSANDFVFDFDKVAELPTQVAAAHLPPTHSLARPCSSCAHLLVAHFKPVCRKLWPYSGGVDGEGAAGDEHSILHWTLNRPPHILPCLTLPGPRPHAFQYFLHCWTKFSEHTQAEYSPLLPSPTAVEYTSIINQYSSIFVRRSLPLDWSAPRV